MDWHTCWEAVEAEAIRRLADPARLGGVEVLGVDEHIVRPSRVGDKDRAVTGMVDHRKPPCASRSRLVLHGTDRELTLADVDCCRSGPPATTLTVPAMAAP